MSGLKQIIEKQNDENKQLQTKNDKLKMENENLAIVVNNLLEKIKKLEKESSVNNKRYLVTVFQFI